MKSFRDKGVRSGAASLIVTIILMIAVVSIVGTLSVISLREAQQASDLDQSARALSAAQAGVEQLSSQINANPDFQQLTCNGNTSSTTNGEINLADPNSNQSVAITCGTVKNQGTNAEGYLLRDQGITFDLSKAFACDCTDPSNPVKLDGIFDNVTYMGLSWNDPQTDITDSSLYPPYGDSAVVNSIDFPNLWLAKAAGPRPDRGDRVEPTTMELTFSLCPRGTNNQNDPNYARCAYTSNFLLNFSGGEPTFTTVVRPGSPNPDITSDCNGSPGFLTRYICQMPHSITCSSDPGNPACAPGSVCAAFDPTKFCAPPLDLAEVIKKHFPSLVSNTNDLARYAVRLTITARYSATHFQVNFANKNAKAVWFNYPFASIDVTARSGQTYRRVTGTRFVQFNTPYNYLNTALFSGRNICKNMVIYKTPGTGTSPGNKKNQNTCNEP